VDFEVARFECAPAPPTPAYTKGNVVEFLFHPIGRVKSPLTDLGQCPHQERDGAPQAYIEIDPEYAPGILGLKPGDRIIVLTWMHLADRDVLQVHPQGNIAKPLPGVFVARSPARPNPVGLHEATVVEIRPPSTILVNQLEALDGTPVIDVKIALKDRR
jgi:tRNA-Thr(GGU) m(6)t(6)A37 methyltransferase TsaA